jgi:glutamyl-tRNA synthetase
MARYRFAPSPTGHLHIGGARTALFNWLLARQNQGQFVLRIEDTDRERSTEEYTASILEGMEWLGLDWDEGPFHQADRQALYQDHIDQLLKAGKAYKCFCTKEELDERRQAAQAKGEKPKYDGRCRQADQSQDKPHCIRFLSPDDGTTVVHDLIKGDVSFENKELDDLIIQRTDGSPTYNLVVVVDDVTMKIDHIIRGDDHLNNSPRQIQFYEAFNYPVPALAHVPMILGADKKRLSKRHGATSVLAYRDMGYWAEALLNYLARLGWSHGDQEIFSKEELIEKFFVKNVGKSAGVFNPEKLNWLNAHYIKEAAPDFLFERTQPFLKEAGITINDSTYATQTLQALKERCGHLKAFASEGHYFFNDNFDIDPKAAKKFLTPESLALLKEVSTKLQSLTDFKEEALKECLQKFVDTKGIKLGQLAQPLRVAMTGGTVSPSIYELLSLLGKDRVFQRLGRVLQS